ncbi:MAG: FMN-binding negative transcriptional regulator [Deltaproteobacteria bacterium]|nr:FMN-binding negative transcriptional regulator [Deltaproteobacteria bacterium]
MYVPSFYREQRTTLIYELILEVGFATVLTEGNTDLISHLPVQLLFDDMGRPELLTHCARANPHWRDLEKRRRAKAIFIGPHAYISPSWYPPAKDNVPTWNYAVVHSKGNVEIIEDPSGITDCMAKFVNHFENVNKTGWELPLEERAIDELMKGIVVFKIKDIEFEAKFKLSQKQDPSTRDKVIQKLEAKSDSSSLVNYMKKAFSND